MSNTNHQDDLDLLLSLEDRVLETPPGSPSGYLSDDGFPKQNGNVDMSAFRNAVADCLDYGPEDAKRSQQPKQEKSSKGIEVEKFSGLRIQNQLLSRVELSNHLSDIRFVRLPTIKNLITGDTLSGCWATIGVLTEKGAPRVSSIGKTFAIWKFGCLDADAVSVFLFGDAYQKICEEKIGTIFALFNSTVRRGNSGYPFSLSVFSAKHILKLGTSPDIGVCQGKGKDGLPCTAVINKRRRKYCDSHKNNSSKYTSSTRAELKGGNLKTGFRDYLKSEGIYVVKPSEPSMNFKTSAKPVKLLSVEGLKKALSKAETVTTNAYSQGIRFLSHMTGGTKVKGEAANLQHQQMKRPDNRSRPIQQPDAKRMKMEERQGDSRKDPKGAGVKMIELDFASSEDEL